MIRVTINGDLVPEADERFAGLFSPVNAVLLDSVGIGKINDDAAFASTVTSDASGNNTGNSSFILILSKIL